MNDIRKKLQEEAAELEHELRTELPKEILTAREHGDLSENAEYHAAKERQGFVNAKLAKVKHRLAELAMIDFTKIPRDRVGYGSKVKVLDVNKDEEITYNLVMSEDADATKNMISTSSPIGKSLLARTVGDIVKVSIPGGVKELEIIEVFTLHDLNGE